MCAGWSEARKQAFKLIDTNPNAYYYRFNAPGEPQRNGAFTPARLTLTHRATHPPTLISHVHTVRLAHSLD